MPLEVRIPALGESITEGVIVRWLKAEGEPVGADDPLLELETDKANVEVPAPAAGILRRLKAEGDTVSVGEVVARIDTDGRGARAEEERAPEGREQASAPEVEEETRGAEEATGEAPVEAAGAGAALSPAVRRLVTEHRIEPGTIAGTGRGGRLTKADVVAHLRQAEEAPGAEPAPAPKPVESAAAPVPSARPKEEEVERVPMTRLRQRIAERLVQAQRTAAILTTFNEADMSAVLELRARHKARFAEVHGVSLGFMSFFARACINALRSMPIVNAQIEGTDVVYYRHVHLGVAVATERGLVVPIVHDADRMSFAGLEKEIDRLALAARENKLGIDDLSRGTFTISNGGVFGSLLSTPILNPPQSAILGMHKIERRPVVVNDEIVIRPMMYLALSYDHRLIDGAEAVTFLVRIKENIEDPTRLLFDI
jgi:2-oxoglutarate dehydrogenase E2 component (dihydrolipoamide succinyltransferase)